MASSIVSMVQIGAPLFYCYIVTASLSRTEFFVTCFVTQPKSERT
jgi:hypothetical protein